jgi:hypothetical protein
MGAGASTVQQPIKSSIIKLKERTKFSYDTHGMTKRENLMYRKKKHDEFKEKAFKKKEKASKELKASKEKSFKESKRKNKT